MKDLAPDITRKRMLIEGFYNIIVNEKIIRDFLEYITKNLELRTYASPIIHSTGNKGKKINQGYDCFVPLIDSGIYLGIWDERKFLSMVLYTCKNFDEKKAIELTKRYWKIKETATHSF